MDDVLRVLLLEDVPDDAELVERELRRTFPSADLRCVDSRDAFVASIGDFDPQLILSDHRLVSFSGMDALHIAVERIPDRPFIFVTGSLDEETAVECIKAGAWDYVLKDRLVRLGAAVSGAIELQRTRATLQRTREQLLQAQKMDALGRLAGGVAHDFNNLATAILGYCELLSETFDDRDPRRGDIGEIRYAAERGAALTQRLLAFSRKQLIDFQPLQINEIVRGTKRLLERLIGENVRVETRLTEDLGWVLSDPGQIEQVLMNLAVNARDAMPQGGTLVIETANMIIDESHLETNPDANAGPHIMLSMSDTGIGMNESTLSRVFEPFFTTKPRGEGTGLGLATVYGIVRQAGGHIVLKSKPEAGTTFRVLLPRTAAPLRPPVARPAPAATVAGGNEHVLLIEDNPSLRRLTRRVLARHGYRVLEASSGFAALANMDETKDPIDLILTDVILPDISGPEVARRLRSRFPQVPALFISGYTDDDVLRRGLLHDGAPFLQKPFTADALALRVREVLDSTA
jgi:signal transduction histidine kinase